MAPRTLVVLPVSFPLLPDVLLKSRIFFWPPRLLLYSHSVLIDTAHTAILELLCRFFYFKKELVHQLYFPFVFGLQVVMNHVID